MPTLPPDAVASPTSAATPATAEPVPGVARASALATLGRAAIPDRFILALLTAVFLASVAPCRGVWREVFSVATIAAIASMFFLQGARLSRQAVRTGLGHWRLHLAILASTFVLFPLLGLALREIAPGLLPRPLWTGILFVCVLPSTVQSAIAFTSIARGNVAAAIVSATASSLIAIFLTPALTGVLIAGAHRGGVSFDELRDIALQLLAPFVLGQLLQTRIGPAVARRKSLLAITDRGSIVLVVYTAFSAAVVGGIWHQVGVHDLVAVLGIDLVMLAAALAATWFGAGALGFSREDRIAVLFCGSKKSLATGVPMARVLFPGPSVGLVIVPMMIFHQVQLMACAVIARLLAQSPEPAGD